VALAVFVAERKTSAGRTAASSADLILAAASCCAIEPRPHA
jgi:hypothetical protein